LDGFDESAALQVDPSDYVEHLAEAMQRYQPQDYLNGDALMFEYQPEVRLLA